MPAPARSASPGRRPRLVVAVGADRDGRGRSGEPSASAGRSASLSSELFGPPGSVCGGGALFASPRKSATSTSPRNTCAKTASKISICSGRSTRVTLASQYSSPISAGSAATRGLRPPGDPLDRDRHAGGAQQVGEMRAQHGKVDPAMRGADGRAGGAGRPHQSPTTHARPARHRHVPVLPVLEHRPESRCGRVDGSRPDRPRTCSACTQSMTSAVPGRLLQVKGAEPAGGGGRPARPGPRWRRVPARRTMATT